MDHPYYWQRPNEVEKVDSKKPDNENCVLPFCAQTTDLAPSFTAEAWDNVEKKISTIRLEDLRGKWVILFFYASDFTFV